VYPLWATRTSGGACCPPAPSPGTGVPESERASVFERFVRGTGSSADGSGLGLALVAQQAALHGGTVELVDSPLGGVRLALRLPQSTPAESAPPVAATRPMPR
ncbi:sensor histidine kinase, partial [Rhodococcus sp. NPDC058514]|uniref:sensor histidine kinase n=1 Tax=Rhodococcus sp. NPDC058514 TaxID=3346532 RepID=UPI0036571A93